jgi:GNAT superfamily N-acetyltransferase
MNSTKKIGLVSIEKVEPSQAARICHSIAATLPEWFGIPEANDRYEKGCLERESFAAKHGDEFIGLIVFEFPFPNNANIYWMAVDKAHHRQNVGTELFRVVEDHCRALGCGSITVETLSPNQSDANYLKTYRFYERCGFKPLFELRPYGPENLMVYMAKQLSTPTNS